MIMMNVSGTGKNHEIDMIFMPAEILILQKKKSAMHLQTQPDLQSYGSN